MKNKRFLLKFLLLLFLLIIIGTIIIQIIDSSNIKKLDSNFGLEFNSERETLGIPILPDNDKWIFSRDNDMLIWKQQVKTVEEPFFEEKIVTLTDLDSVSTEENSFYYRVDNKLAYSIVLFYAFSNKDKSNSSHIRLITYKEEEKYGQDDFFVVVTDTISIQKADSILQSWDIGINLLDDGGKVTW